MGNLIISIAGFFMEVVTSWSNSGLSLIWIVFSINFIPIWWAKTSLASSVVACAFEVSEFGLTKLPNPPDISDPVLIQADAPGAAEGGRSNMDLWRASSLPGSGEEDLVLWVDQYRSLRGISPPCCLPIVCCSGGERPPWQFAISFRSMSIKEVSCGPCKAIHYCSMPLEQAILWLPGILPLPLVLVFARRSLEGNCPCPAVFSRQDKWFMALLCLFGPFTWHKRARVWLKISVLLCRKEPGLGGAFSFPPPVWQPSHSWWWAVIFWLTSPRMVPEVLTS